MALFGKNLSGYTQMSLRLARFRGTDKNEFVDSGRADGNFFDLLDAGMAFLFKHLSQSGKILEYRQNEDFMVTLWRKEGSGTVQSDPEVI